MELSLELSLDPVEVRALGCLIEKKITTPEHYPLTLNSMLNACNQTTNRDPVTNFDEDQLGKALERLREKSLIWVVRGGRALKYEHRFAEKLELASPELAVMCVLMLRGPQTAGEIRGRTGRLHEFASLEEVDRALENLASSDPPRVKKLPRVPGAKEHRFAHLLGGEGAATGDVASMPTEASGGEGRGVEGRGSDGRMAQLAEEVEALRREVDELKQQVMELKVQLQ